MKKNCPNCHLVNFKNAAICLRCEYEFGGNSIVVKADGVPGKSLKTKIIKRAFVCASVVVLTLAAFYLSLLLTAKKLTYDERKTVGTAIDVLDRKGFAAEVFWLKYITAFRANDNWLNASTKPENAYAATNFPFEIMTVYPEFFSVTADETERAAILLHEVRHLTGADEKQAYEFVWKNRKKLGWTKENYEFSVIWLNVRKQTREFAPDLFVCADKPYADCTE